MLSTFHSHDSQVRAAFEDAIGQGRQLVVAEIAGRDRGQSEDSTDETRGFYRAIEDCLTGTEHETPTAVNAYGTSEGKMVDETS